MFQKKTVYLSWPITGQDFAWATDRRNYIKESIMSSEVEFLDPMRAKEYLKDEKNITLWDNPMFTAKSTITRDIFDVKNADVILLNFLWAEKVSIWSITELARAYQRRKPVILVIEENDRIHNHPWIREMSGFVVHTLEDGIKILKAVLNVA